MRKPSEHKIYYSLFFSLIILFSLAIYWLYPTDQTIAQNNSAPLNLENYDIRIDKSAKLKVEDFVEQSGQTPSNIKQFKQKSFEAEKNLRLQLPNITISRNDTLQIPEVISLKTDESANFITSQSITKRDEILLDFIKQNSQLFGIGENQFSQLEKVADYTNPDGNLSFVQFNQKINEIPVFGGEIKAGFTKDNQIIRIINNLAPNLERDDLSQDFGNAQPFVIAASRYIHNRLHKSEISLVKAESDHFKSTFQSKVLADKITAEKIYFPLENGFARTAWRILFRTSKDDFYIIIDVQTNTLLWRKNITEQQTETATYNVYGNLTSLMKTADSPAPFSPGCLDPNNCPQPTIIPRLDFTFIGNEPPYTFNNLGWIPDGENRTIGNNAEAGIDRDGINGIDPNGWAFGNPNRVFKYTYNPAPGNPAPGEEPVPTTQTYPPSQFQQGSITNAFYAVNRWHDETYLLGFTEPAFNFQVDNFNRGGIGNDSISVEVQEGTGTNGANFSTPADGGRPRLQLFVWTNPTPDRDGALDAQVIVHELTHGLSNRLHGNITGLSTNMARGMGEGWSDFYSLALLSEPTDDQCGIYPVGSYSTFELLPGYANYYYGIRRFPTAKISCVGTNGNPHNPLTFGNLNAGNCSNFQSAFPRGPIGSNTCDQIHNAGEIWSQALWEVRGLLIEQHGAAEGNRRALQYITDGMKLSPLNPNMLQSRDAIIAAANASDPNDVQWVRRGFARRGMGFSAQVLSTSPANVIEAFDYLENVSLRDPLNFIEINGNNNGFPEPGETLKFSVSLENGTGATVTNVSANINGGGEVSYGAILVGNTFTRDINYTIPKNTQCGSLHEINVNITSDIGTKTETRRIRIGQPQNGAGTFENTTTINVPFAGSNSGSGPAEPYPSIINVSGVSGQQTINLELTNINHTWVGDVDILLEAPGGQKMVIMSDAFSASNRTNTVISTLSLSDSAKNNMPLNGVPPVSGYFKPTNHGAADDFDDPAPAPPYANPAPAGSETFLSVFGSDGSKMNGEWKLWIDDDSGSDIGTIGGWKITFESYFCVSCVTLCPPNKVIADFDGDGRSDISVFRPSEGNWYMNQSNAGFSVIHWGVNSDIPTPSDYDGDGKADLAIFRPNADGSQPDFYILNSSNFTFTGYSWGLPDDIPVINDFDGDGKADPTVFRPSQRLFYVLQSLTLQILTSRPMPGGIPLTGDFDGDGKGDFATYNNGQWFLTQSTNNHQTDQTHFWGTASDKIVSADYDGDGRTDLAVFRPNNGTWYIRNSGGGDSYINFGLTDDIPVPADFDGDGKTDVAVYRNGLWYINSSASGGVLVNQFGLSTDSPIQSHYFPQ